MKSQLKVGQLLDQISKLFINVSKIGKRLSQIERLLYDRNKANKPEFKNTATKTQLLQTRDTLKDTNLPIQEMDTA